MREAFKPDPCMQPSREAARITYSMRLEEVEMKLDRLILPWLESGLNEGGRYPSIKRVEQYLFLYTDDTLIMRYKTTKTKKTKEDDLELVTIEYVKDQLKSIV